MSKQKKQQKGICPECSSELKYGVIEVNGEQIYFPVECSNASCGFTGTEWYETKFVHIEKDSC